MKMKGRLFVFFFLFISFLSSHAVQIKTIFGTAYAWGSNSNGQVGDGTQIQRNSPVTIPGLTGVNISQVSSGVGYSLALSGNGVIYGWGSNSFGQLGDNSNAARLSPVTVPGISNAIQIAAGNAHSLALTKDGRIYAWGLNNYGQLGDGTTTNKNIPTLVGPANVLQLCAGAFHSLALAGSGVYAWGGNSNGQLGFAMSTAIPTQLSGISNIVQISCGYAFSMALNRNGSVLAWGDNSFGQLGDGTTTSRISPSIVPGVSNVVQISAGFYYSMVLARSGYVRVWGDNSNGQLGDGTTTNRNSVFLVPGVSDVVQISAGIFHSIALLRNGSIMAWGSNVNGQLGDGTTVDRTSPVIVSGLFNISKVSAGYSHSLAVFVTSVVVNITTTGQVTTGSVTTAAASVKDSSNKNTLTIIIGVSVGGGLAIIFIALGILICVILIKRRKKSSDGPNPNPHSLEMQLKGEDIPLIPEGEIQITKKIGGGNFSEVFLGSWNRIEVALKLVNDQQMKEEMKKELKLMKKLHHPNVVTTYGLYINQSGDFLLVLEYMKEGNLSSYLKVNAGKLQTEELLSFAFNVGRGMAYLSSQSIIHHDLAARNVLLKREVKGHTVKITDFGLSHVASGDYFTSSSSNFPIRWSAPEVYKEKHTNTKSDVWSYGIVLHEIFSYGTVPYKDLSNEQVLEKVPNGYQMDAPKDCPAFMYELMKKCWQLDHRQRPTFKDIVDAIETEYPKLDRDDEDTVSPFAAFELKGSLTLENKLGKGNFGEVFSGKLDHALVACKEIKSENLVDIESEVKILSSLQHENIVQFIGMKDLQGRIFIVMEFMNHGSLLDYVRKNVRTLENEELRSFATQICTGMEFLHSKSIIHKDLALRNILCSINFNTVVCKISDFGMSRVLPQFDNYYKIQNTEAPIPVRWAAPELLFSDKISPACDVFSFGVVLVELFSKGKAPWEGFTNQQVISALKNSQKIPQPENCPPEIKQMIINCCEHDHHNRPTFKELKLTFSPKSEEKDDTYELANIVNEGEGGYIKSPVMDNQETKSTKTGPNLLTSTYESVPDDVENNQ